MPSRRSGEKPTRQRNKLVIDTGVLVSAFAFGGNPREAVRKAVVEGQIFVSPDLLEEYREVPSALAKRGKIDNRQFRDLIAGIAAVVANASLVYPKERLEICRDPADDMLLGAALRQRRTSSSQGTKIFCPCATSPSRSKSSPLGTISS